MIVKIMKPAGNSFPGVNYNDKKIEKGNGELMLMKNFPSFVNENSSKEEVRNYLASVSKNDKVKLPQFHAAISTKFREHSKEELTKVAEDFMKEMGYGEQPFIVVFHNDTDNNHVHIVSTRVSKANGKKIDDSYEKLKSQSALNRTMLKLYGENHLEKIDKLLKYKIGSLKQLELLMERNGFKLSPNKNIENSFQILKNGVNQKTISGSQIVFNDIKNYQRAKQIKAILKKYKEVYSNKVFKVEDNRKKEGTLPEEKHTENSKPKIEFESELQKKMKDAFGIDIVFNHKDGYDPFGYTLIDNKSGSIFKGSDITKMNELFEFTSHKIDKKQFEIFKDFNLSGKDEKEVLLERLKKENPEIKDFMLFENKKRVNIETYRKIQFDVKDLLKNNGREKDGISIFKSDNGKNYVIDQKNHFLSSLESLIGEKEFLKFSGIGSSNHSTMKQIKEDGLEKAIDELVFEFMKSSGGGTDPGEDELKKRKKRKK
jgi:hypothetical protein